MWEELTTEEVVETGSRQVENITVVTWHGSSAGSSGTGMVAVCVTGRSLQSM